MYELKHKYQVGDVVVAKSEVEQHERDVHGHRTVLVKKNTLGIVTGIEVEADVLRYKLESLHGSQKVDELAVIGRMMMEK